MKKILLSIFVCLFFLSGCSNNNTTIPDPNDLIAMWDYGYRIEEKVNPGIYTFDYIYWFMPIIPIEMNTSQEKLCLYYSKFTQYRNLDLDNIGNDDDILYTKEIWTKYKNLGIHIYNLYNNQCPFI